MVSEVTDDTFEQDVLQATQPVVVDFASCAARAASSIWIIEDLASQHGERVKFLKLNVDDNPGTSARYNVLSIPTVILGGRGAPGGRHRRTLKGHYESAWERWLVAAA